MEAIGKALLSLGYDKWALILIVLGIFIDITPGIKWNPIKTIFKYLGKAFNSSVESELNTLKSAMNIKFDELQSEQLAQRETLDRLILDQTNKEIGRLRWEVIDFQNSIMNGVKHSRDQYNHVLDSYDKYILIMQNPNIDSDEYFRTVQEQGEKIREHYERYRDQDLLFF